MQILEYSFFGLRSVRMEFRSSAQPVSITLFPMVHVGEQKFYDQVYADAFAHDVVLLEGIRTPVGRNLTRSYRWLGLERLELVVQPKPPAQDSVAARIVLADLTAPEFHNEWRKVSLLMRAALFVGAPLYGLYMRHFASRERIASRLALEDLTSPEEILGWSRRFEPLNRSLLHARDQRLVEALIREIRAGSNKRIAVIYGARHMRAVLRELTKCGFHCADARWRTIISI